MEHYQETLDEFTIIKEVGIGGQAVVKLGESKEGRFAIKIYRGQVNNIQALKNELTILKTLDHPNIIKLYDVRETSKYMISNGQNKQMFECLALILEYCEGGDIFDYLAPNPMFQTPMFEAPLARAYFKKMLSAIQHMHAKKVTHRDLKPENVVLNHEFNLKIIDFGLATWIKTGKLKEKVGTPRYLPPEYWKGGYNGADVDIFASGIILFCMVTGRPPFESTNLMTNLSAHYHYLITLGKKAEYWQFMTDRCGEQIITAQFKDLIEKMFVQDPKKRLTIEEILAHEWVQGPTYQLPQIQQVLRSRYENVQTHRAELERRRQIEMQERYNQGWRAVKTEHSDEILKKIHLDPQQINEQDIKPSDYIVNVTPKEFLILLHEFLCYNKSSILCGDNAQQRFVIETEEDSNQAIVKLSYKEFDVKISVNVILRLYKTKDERTKVVFEREEEDDRLVSYRLVNVLKDEFECLKTLEKKEQMVSE